MISLWVAVAVTFYTYYAAKQRDAMIETLKRTTQMVESAKVQADAAQRAADAAEESNRITREAVEKGDRAYVADKGIKVISNVLVGGRPEVVVVFLNAGKTPALNVTMSATMMLTPHTLPKEPQYGRIAGSSKSTILPGAEEYSNTVSIVEPLSAGEVEALSRKKAWLYVYGVVRYEDVFGKRHNSRFCYFHVPRTDNVFSLCSKHNSMD